MKYALVLLVAVLALGSLISVDAGGAGLCIGCTLIVHVSSKLARKHKFPIAEAINYWCEALGGDQKWIVDVCKLAVGSLADKIQGDFDAGHSPDFTCQKTLNMCDSDKCSLFPYTAADEKRSEEMIAAGVSNNKEYWGFAEKMFADQFSASVEAASIFDYVFSTLTGWSKNGGIKRFEDYQALVQYKPMEVTGGGHGAVKPAVDVDGDLSSTFETLRGTHWRGKDCNDDDATIHPSRRSPGTHGPEIDHNCNGIYGVDPITKKSYEDLYCADTKQFEFVQIGDSASAGFTIPPCWLNADCITPNVYKDLLNVVMDEADFPSCSLVTGFNATSCPSLYPQITPFTSVYDFARSQNPCIHRAYHNIGINGADSVTMGGSGEKNQIYSFKRDPTNDVRSAIFFALIGNDVCGSSADVKDMTDPDVFERGWLNALEYIDTQVAPGSWVFAGGLVDGRLLYDVMNDLEHPIGGFKYTKFYDYLNCYENSPCSGWLNTDPKVRDRTTEHANKLNERLKNIVATKKFKNFRILYNDYQGQVKKIINSASEKGYPLQSFIAEVDSFHPSSTLYSALARSMINYYSFSDAAEIFSLNPNADKIFQTFGKDLNGY